MSVCVCVCVCVSMYVCVCVFLCLCVCICMCVCLCVCVCVCTCMCVCVFVFVPVCVCVCVSLSRFTCRGLFECHKLLFSFQMCAKILEVSGKLNMDEYSFFLRGGLVRKPAALELDPHC